MERSAFLHASPLFCTLRLVQTVVPFPNPKKKTQHTNPLGGISVCMLEIHCYHNSHATSQMHLSLVWGPPLLQPYLYPGGWFSPERRTQCRGQITLDAPCRRYGASNTNDKHHHIHWVSGCSVLHLIWVEMLRVVTQYPERVRCKRISALGREATSVKGLHTEVLRVWIQPHLFQCLSTLSILKDHQYRDSYIS